MTMRNSILKHTRIFVRRMVLNLGVTLALLLLVVGAIIVGSTMKDANTLVTNAMQPQPPAAVMQVKN